MFTKLISFSPKQWVGLLGMGGSRLVIQDHLDHGASKETIKSLPRVDSSVLLMYHYQSNLGSNDPDQQRILIRSTSFLVPLVCWLLISKRQDGFLGIVNLCKSKQSRFKQQPGQPHVHGHT